MASLYDIWNASILDSQHYFRSTANMLISGIRPKEVFDFHGNRQPGLELQFSIPSMLKETFALGANFNEDTRFVRREEEALNFNDLDVLLGYFGYDRENFLSAQGFVNDRVISASVMSALINYNNADDPTLALEPEEIQDFDRLLSDLEKNGLSSDFKYVVPIPSPTGTDSYRVVFEPLRLSDNPSLDDLQQQTLTDEQQEVWDLFIEKSRGATIEEKAWSIDQSSEFLPKNLLNHARQWLENEKVRAKELGSSVTDPFGLDAPCIIEMGLPSYDYKSNFLDTEYGSHRVDTFIVNFQTALTDPNGHPMATIPVSISYFCTSGTEPDSFTKIEFDAFSVKDRDGNLLSWESPLYQKLVQYTEEHLDVYGDRLKDLYMGTASNVFMVLPDAHEVRRADTAVTYKINSAQTAQTTLIMADNLSEKKRLDVFKAALMEKLPSREEYEKIYQHLLQTQPQPDKRPKGARLLNLAEVIGEFAVADSQNAYRLEDTKIQIDSDYVLFCLSATRDAQMQACALTETRKQSQKESLGQSFSRGR